MDDFHARDLIKALSALTLAIEESTRQKEDEGCNAAIYAMLLARAETISKRLKHVARLARALDASTTPR